MKNDMLLVDTDRTKVSTSKDGNLEIDWSLRYFFKSRNIVGARALLSFLRATPDALVNLYIFTTEEVEIFKNNVLQALKGVLPDEALEERPPIKRAMGALIPDHLKGKIINEDED